MRVVAPGDAHDGQISTIHELLDDDVDVCIKFKGDSELYAFKRDELQVVPTPKHKPTSKPTVSKASGSQPKRSAPVSAPLAPAPPGWYPDPSDRGKRRYWDGQAWHAAIPATKTARTNWPVLIVIGVGLLIGIIVVSLMVHGGPSGGCGSSGPTCDATPKVDGVYRVNGGGTFDVGILPGWIESPGPRNPARYPNCMWARLSGPDPGDIKMIIESDLANGSTGRTRVHIDKTDYAFWSKGCEPWDRLSDE